MKNGWESSDIFCITVNHMHTTVIRTLNAHSRSVPVRFGVKVCIFTVAIVVCDGRKLKSSLLTFPLYQKIRGEKKVIARGGGGVLLLWMKVKWFFQHSFWSFCSALEVKQNRLTRVEACAGNMSPRVGKKVSGCFQTMRTSDPVPNFFFFF